MSRRLACFIATTLAVASGAADAQRVNTYVQSQTGQDLLTYGLPVPLPIDSLTPVDGFRSYPSIEARLQGLALDSPELSAHDVGRTFNNRTVWAYVVGDADGTDVEGRAEAAFFINASTHAREWGTPEVSTGTIERLLAGANDGGIVRYVLDNTRLVIIPVHNVDGVLQTQRFPTQAIIGQDPDVNGWPRDGRMRRKNMRGVDENLLSFGDHLGGIDLNRNHPPFWATSVGQGGSSSNPNSLTYHGVGQHSEPENVALRTAAQLGPETRFRLGIDVHTFSRVFFSSNTARSRLNAIQANLTYRLQQHHFVVAGKFYQDVPDPPNRGIGTAAEYFAYQWLVPAWTLELEPQNSPVEYGGLNVNHGGFILPASEARRVREGWAESHLVAFYMMAGPPHLARVRYYDVASNTLVAETRWQFDAASGRRVRSDTLPGSLRQGARYRAELAFSKPMRIRDAAGQVTDLPGSAGELAAQPAVALLSGSSRTPLSTAAGAWISDPARTLRYRDDTFAFEFDAPASTATYQLEVETTDLVGHRLDADPATPVDWSAGAWSEFEGSDGVDGDFGGSDRSTALRVESAPEVELVGSSLSGNHVGEGDTITLRFRRTTAGPNEISLLRIAPNGASESPPVTVAIWAAGEAGEKTVTVVVPDDLVPGDDASFPIAHETRVAGQRQTLFQLSPTLLDNDASDLAVLRVKSASTLAERWDQVREGTPARVLVLDGGGSYSLPVATVASPAAALGAVGTEVTLGGNGAVLSVPPTRRGAPALRVASGGLLRLDRVELQLAQPEQGSADGVIANAGALRVSRAVVGGRTGVSESFMTSSGDARIVQSRLDGLISGSAPTIQVRGGRANLSATTMTRNAGVTVVDVADGELRLDSASVIANTLDFTTFIRRASSGPLFRGSLLQDNVVSTALSPPVLENCDVPAISLGFNIENFSRCGFVLSGDVSGVDLGAFVFNVTQGGYAPLGVAIDGGATAAPTSDGCGAVDQRGAPRPQALTAGAMPRCDIGAIELGVNPYRGIWQPARSGHGIELHTAGNQLLLVWYTYADDGTPTSYQAAAPLTGPHWEADLLLPRRNPQTGAVTAPPVGRVMIDFASDVDATLRWRFDARGTDGSERIRPAVFAAGEPRFEVSGVWYPPAESGYGATVSRRGEITAVVLYYYDADGNIRWVLGNSNGADALSIPMLSFIGFCPDCDAAQMPVRFVPAGSVLVYFQTPWHARLDTAITYPGTSGGTWNRQRAVLLPLHDAVDNRAAAAALP